MKLQRGIVRLRSMAAPATIVAMVLVVTVVLGACGGADATAEVIVVTATATQGPVVLVVTATPTPASPAETQAPAPTQPPADTPVPPPTDTPAQPTISPEQIQTAQAILTQSAPQATDTPVAPADTAPPPPPTEPPTAAATSAPKPTAKPSTSLTSYGVIYSNFDGGSEADANRYNVWVVRGDGASASKIVDTATMPAYSPNGQKIAYFKTFEGIVVYDLNTKKSVMAVPNNWAEFASFSPDGKQLVYHQWVGNWWSADVSLYVVNADGSGSHKLVPGERPVWSPKGDLIAYDTCQGTSCGIFVVKPNGQGIRQITSDAGGNAAWSPDGKKIAFCSSKDGDAEIYVVGVDGKGLKQLTQNKGNDTNPAFSPDGNYIFFLSDQNGTAWAVRVMRADGSDVKTVRKVGVAPRWQFARMWAGWW